jgi:ABC-type multidrug transport system ATPase subunit/ABC-type multidrug transport system permease subunit
VRRPRRPASIDGSGPEHEPQDPDRRAPPRLAASPGKMSPVIEAPAQTGVDVLRARGVEVVLPTGRRILGPSSLEVTPGSLIALLGPSGSGKSTLLRTMAGITEPTAGAVLFNAEPATLRVDDLGYVPQRETVHGRLTVAEALRYAAVLRLDASSDIDAVIAQVLGELDLTEQADTLIRDLSGGERRRAACGLELVGRPKVLLLDEPTSGLDPVLERRLMLMLRRLADQGRAVVVATHATASLDLCDAVAVLQAGEGIVHVGGSDDGIAYLERAAGAAEDRDAAAPAGNAPVSAPHRPATTTRPLRVELRLLAERYARTLLRDGRTLAALLGQAPLIGLLIAVLFSPKAFVGDHASPGDAAQLVFLLMTGSIWLGVTAACREVVKERGIIEREFDVGLRLDAYVLAKAAVLFALSAVQVLLMVGVVLLLQPLGTSFAAALTLIGLATAVAWVSVAMGLVVSTVARSVDQAASVVPLLLIPQLLFAGALVPLTRMPHAVEALAQLTYARWAYAGMGSAIDLEGRLQRSSETARALGFGRAFFTLAPGVAAAALGGFIVVLLLVCVLLLNRRASPDEA